MKRVFLVGLVIACGSSAPPFPSDDVAAFDAHVDTTLPGDASDVFSTVDAPDAPKFGGGGPFLCNGCVCDGTLHLCEHFSGGAANMPVTDAGDLGDASACDLDAGSSCTAIPIECLPNPSCACLLPHYSPMCTCEIDPSGNGLVVTCNFP